MINDLLAMTGCVVSIVVVLGYCTIAPWHMSRTGRHMVALLWSIALLMAAVAARRFLGPDYMGREFIIGATYLFVTTCVAGIGYEVLYAQLAGRRRARLLRSFANHPSNQHPNESKNASE